MLYREVEVEKYWDLPNTDPKKKEKIRNAILTEKYGASLKKDGEYLRAIYDTDGEIWIIGRGTNAKEVHNLDKHLVFITEWLRANFKPGTCILGELYVQGKTSRAIRAYTGSLIPKSLKNQQACPPTFYIFDVWAVNGRDLMDKSYQDRMWILNSSEFQNYQHSQIQYSKMIVGSKNILDFIAESFENGEEGVVLVDLNSKPAPGKRTSWKSIKVKKEFSNIDCFFTGNWRPPTREYTGSEILEWPYWENTRTEEKVLGKLYSSYIDGMAIEPVTKSYFLSMPGSLEVGVFKGKEIVPICYLSGLSDELKEKFVKVKESVSMRPIVISGMETTDASIRHPKFVGFRDDISINDCVWEKIFGE